MRQIVLNLDDEDYTTIQAEIELRLKRGAAICPENPEHAVIPDGTSNQAGALLAECVRDLEEYRARDLPPISAELARLPDPKRFRYWRQWRGLTLVPVSKMLGCSIAQASSLERGCWVPSSLVAKAEKLMKQ